MVYSRPDLDQKHVRAARPELDRELLQEVRLQRAHTNDEEAAESDREKDDSRLVSRAREAQDSVAQRKGARPRDRPHPVDDARADQMKHEREAGEARADDRANSERRRLPPGDADQG